MNKSVYASARRREVQIGAPTAYISKRGMHRRYGVGGGRRGRGREKYVGGNLCEPVGPAPMSQRVRIW